MMTRTKFKPRTRAAVIALAVAGAAATLGLAWYLGSPLFINQTVNESFPATASTAAMAGMTKDAMAKPQAGMTNDAMAKPQAGMAKDAQPAVATPAMLAKGNFTVVDTLHKAAGTATVYRLADGKRVLRFEGFSATNGPDLYVYLSGHAMPRSSGELHSAGDVNLGRLKGNVGDQNYELPDDLDLSTVKSVVIYCRQFSVVFSSAELASM